MNPFKKQVEEKQTKRYWAEKNVFQLSRRISEIICLRPDQVGFGEVFEQVPGYKIVRTSRCFSTGWVELFEVVPKEYDSVEDLPYIELEGNRTINLPPFEITQDFLEKLKKIWES